MSLQEIEVKILEVQVEKVIEKLSQMGATPSFDGEMTAWFFDTPAGTFRDRGDVLRLRKEGDECVLAYKKHLERGEAKVMEETESLVADAEACKKILLSSGFEVVKSTQKFRKQFELEGAHVVIDNYQGDLASIPEFIEVEAASVDRLREVVEELGFQMEQCLNWSTRELVRHYLG